MTFAEALLMVLVVLGGVTALAVWQRSRIDALLGALRRETQSIVNAQAQSLVAQLGQLTATVQQGLASSGMLVTKAQEGVAAELKGSQALLARIGQQLGEVQQAGRDLSDASKTLQLVLGGAKSRGLLGEVGLERLLADALPGEGYQTQFRFSTGNFVDAVVRSGDKLICIDSKFPLDDYRRMAEKGEDARKEFAQAVRKHADSIAAKYILPDEATLDIALMFVPSESVYYELLMTEDARGRVDAYCRSKGVIPVSPNTLYAYLSAILMGLKGMQVQENARKLLGSLAGLDRQFEAFAIVYEKLGTHLRHAQQSYEEAESKLAKARGALEQMAQGALPEAAPAKALEGATKE